MKLALFAIAATSVTLASSANAGFAFTQTTAQAPTYGSTLNFDEANGPTGQVGPAGWQSHGISSMFDGSNNSTYVADFSDNAPWVNSGNAAYGNYGIFINFETAVDALSVQAWDPSGPPTMMGGGIYVYVLDDNGDIIDAMGFTPAWGGIGKTWYNVVGTGGSTFKHFYISGNSFFPETYIDNLSWNTVPGPGGIAMFGIAALCRGRRRR